MIVQGVELKGVRVIDLPAVTSGLMYYIDAGDSASYWGAGTTINNISGTGISASTFTGFNT